MVITAQIRAYTTEKKTIGRRTRSYRKVSNIRYRWDDNKLHKTVYIYHSFDGEINSEREYVQPYPDACTFLDAMGEANKRGNLAWITLRE